jgi:hydrogenase maturation protease
MNYVLGLGNVLMGDDGFGPAVIRAFDAEYTVGPDVEIVDLGTPGLDMTPWLADAEHVIIVDTVNTGQPPGTLRLFVKQELLRHRPSVRVGPHDPGVQDALGALEFAGRGPADVVLLGIVPESVGMDLELTPLVRGMVPAAVDLLVKMLRYFGVTVTRRRCPTPEVRWWTVPETAILH